MPELAEDVVAGIRSQFDTQFGAAEPAVQILHDNELPLGKKPGTTVPDQDTDEWVRVEITMGAATLPEIDSVVSDQVGRVRVAHFSPLGSGDARAWAVFRVIQGIFQGQKIAGAKFQQVEPPVSASDPSNVWFMLVASAVFSVELTP